MRFGECNACQIGDHKNHRRVVQAAPKGMLGGVVCDCKGECRDVTPEQRLERMGVPPEIFRFALPQEHGDG